MLKNKNNFEIIHSFFSLLGRKLIRPTSYVCFYSEDYLSLLLLLNYVLWYDILEKLI